MELRFEPDQVASILVFFLINVDIKYFTLLTKD